MNAVVDELAELQKKEEKVTDKPTRRKFLKGLAVAAGIGVLAACAPKVVKETVIVEKPVEKVVKETVIVEGTPKVVEKVVTATPPPKIKRVVKITHWMQIDPPNPVYEEMVRRFNEKQKGQIEVEMQVVPWNAYHQQLTTAIVAGSAPDVVVLPGAWMGEFWKAKWVLPLDPYLEKWDGRKNFPEACYDVRRPSPKDPVVMMPYKGWASMLYYRRDWFEEEGIKVPTTMDEFVEACKAVARPKENRWAYALRGGRGGQWFWEPFVFAYGGRYVDDEGNIVIDSPDAIAGNKMQVELFTKHGVLRPDCVTDDWPSLVKGVQTGEIAMMNHGLHIRRLLTDALGDKIAVTKIPKGKIEGTCRYVGGCSILSTSEHPDEAWEWVAYWGSKEVAEMLIENTVQDMVPENLLVADHPKFREDEFYRVTAEMQKAACYTPLGHPRYGSLTEKLWSPTMQQALLGEITPEEQMKIYAEYMRETG